MEHRHQSRGSKIKGQGSQGTCMQLCSDRSHCHKDPIVNQGCFQQLRALKILGHIQDSQLQESRTFAIYVRTFIQSYMCGQTCKDAHAEITMLLNVKWVVDKKHC